MLLRIRSTYRDANRASDSKQATGSTSLIRRSQVTPGVPHGRPTRLDRVDRRARRDPRSASNTNLGRRVAAMTFAPAYSELELDEAQLRAYFSLMDVAALLRHR